jgi:predicted ribosomally synthesized peptide with nif11-like leader
MAFEQLQQFLARVQAEPALRQAVEEAMTADDVARLAQELGFEVSGSEILRFSGRTASGVTVTRIDHLVNIPGATSSAQSSSRGRCCRLRLTSPRSFFPSRRFRVEAFEGFVARRGLGSGWRPSHSASAIFSRARQRFLYCERCSDARIRSTLEPLNCVRRDCSRCF